MRHLQIEWLISNCSSSCQTIRSRPTFRSWKIQPIQYNNFYILRCGEWWQQLHPTTWAWKIISNLIWMDVSLSECVCACLSVCKGQDRRCQRIRRIFGYYLSSRSKCRCAIGKDNAFCSVHLTSVWNKLQFMRQCVDCGIDDEADDKPETKPRKMEKKRKEKNTKPKRQL